MCVCVERTAHVGFREKESIFYKLKKYRFWRSLKLVFYTNPHVQVRKIKEKPSTFHTVRSESDSHEKRSHDPKESPWRLGGPQRKKPGERLAGNRSSSSFWL